MKHLFDATKLADMPVKNRLICSAAYEGMADQESHIVNGRKITEYYKARYKKAVSILNK